MPGTVTNWLQRLKNGDDTVTEKLWSHYSPGLRNQLAKRCQALKICDEEDIVTASFYRLISSLQNHERYRCSNRSEFWRLLTIIARNEIGDWIKYDRAYRRGGSHTFVPLNEAEVSQPVLNTKSEKALLAKFEQLSSELDRPEFMRVIDLKQQGLSNAEVALKMEFSLRTVQYIIADIRTAWKRYFDEID